MVDNQQSYIKKIAEEKKAFHQRQAKLSFEEKAYIVIELQKFDIEMRKRSNRRSKDDKLRMVWSI